MFTEMLAESVAKAIFWLLIIFGVTVSLRFLIRDLIDFILRDGDDKKKEDEV